MNIFTRISTLILAAISIKVCTSANFNVINDHFAVDYKIEGDTGWHRLEKKKSFSRLIPDKTTFQITLRSTRPNGRTVHFEFTPLNGKTCFILVNAGINGNIKISTQNSSPVRKGFTTNGLCLKNNIKRDEIDANKAAAERKFAQQQDRIHHTAAQPARVVSDLPSQHPATPPQQHQTMQPAQFPAEDPSQHQQGQAAAERPTHAQSTTQQQLSPLPAGTTTTTLELGKKDSAAAATSAVNPPQRPEEESEKQAREPYNLSDPTGFEDETDSEQDYNANTQAQVLYNLFKQTRSKDVVASLLTESPTQHFKDAFTLVHNQLAENTKTSRDFILNYANTNHIKLPEEITFTTLLEDLASQTVTQLDALCNAIAGAQAISQEWQKLGEYSQRYCALFIAGLQQ